MNQQNLSSFIWSVPDLLRGDYKQQNLFCLVRVKLLRHMKEKREDGEEQA